MRGRLGKNPHASVGLVDSQSVKTVLKGDIKGFDGGKKVKGIKRNILVVTNGFVLANYVTPANMHDKEGAKRVIDGIKFRMPRLSTIFGDSAYRGDDLQNFLNHDGYKIEIITRPQKSFKIQPKRWIVERTLAWADQNRRMSKDYERYPQTSELLIEICMIRLMIRRLAKLNAF